VSQRPRAGGLVEQFENPAGQLAAVLRRHDQPRLSMPNDAGDAPHAGGDDRAAQSHGFKMIVPNPCCSDGQDEDVGGGQRIGEAQNVGTK